MASNKFAHMHIYLAECLLNFSRRELSLNYWKDKIQVHLGTVIVLLVQICNHYSFHC